MELRKKVETTDDRQAAIYHRVYAKEGFNEAAQTLFQLVQQAQKVKPGAPRILFLDIDGHRNRQGGFDADMLELQTHFILGFLMQFLTEAHLPLGGTVRRKEGSPQSDDIPEALNIEVAPEEPPS